MVKSEKLSHTIRVGKSKSLETKYIKVSVKINSNFTCRATTWQKGFN